MKYAAESVPSSQLFRVLLLRMLETHTVLIPLVCNTTSQSLKLAHQHNAYTLSEIQSWLEVQLDNTDLTPSYSAVQLAELRDGVASCMILSHAQRSTVPLTRSVLPAQLAQVLGTRRARSSQPAAPIKPALVRSLTGQIIFRQQSSSEKPSCILPTPLNDTLLPVDTPVSHSDD